MPRSRKARQLRVQTARRLAGRRRRRWVPAWLPGQMGMDIAEATDGEPSGCRGLAESGTVGGAATMALGRGAEAAEAAVARGAAMPQGSAAAGVTARRLAGRRRTPKFGLWRQSATPPDSSYNSPVSDQVRPSINPCQSVVPIEAAMPKMTIAIRYLQLRIQLWTPSPTAVRLCTAGVQPPTHGQQRPHATSAAAGRRRWGPTAPAQPNRFGGPREEEAKQNKVATRGHRHRDRQPFVAHSSSPSSSSTSSMPA